MKRNKKIVGIYKEIVAKQSKSKKKVIRPYPDTTDISLLGGKIVLSTRDIDTAWNRIMKIIE